MVEPGPPPYVALGDSYSAGTGSGERVDACFRSRGAFPVQVAQRLGVALAFQACERAVVADVEANQLAALGGATTLVTVTAGGNDAGFGPVLTRAAAPAWLEDATDAIVAARRIIHEVLPGRLRGLYGEIRDRAPDARVLVVGYPRLFAGVDCSLLTFFTEAEMDLLNDVADELAAVTEQAAVEAACTFIDVRDAFTGHAVCAEQAFLHGLTWPVTESFHPNADGQAAYADAVAAVLGLPDGPTPPTVAPPRVDDGPCVPGSAPPFGLPDLSAPQALRLAIESGLDADEVRRLAARTRPSLRTAERGDGEQRAAAERLQALDARVRADRQ